MTVIDSITELFCTVNDPTDHMSRRGQAKLYPSAVVTLAMLCALKRARRRTRMRRLPLHLMCDPRDIGVVAEQQAAAGGLPTITVYEQIPAGIGFSQRLYELRDDLLRGVAELVRRCQCERGCPACVGPVSEEADESVDAKALTLALVEAFNGKAM